MTAGISSSDTRVQVSIDEFVATVTINRPEKLNAIDPEMLIALRSAFEALDRASNVRVIVLTAAGDRAFSVGADVNAWAALEPIDMWRRWVRDGHATLDVIASVRQPASRRSTGWRLEEDWKWRWPATCGLLRNQRGSDHPRSG